MAFFYNTPLNLNITHIPFRSAAGAVVSSPVYTDISGQKDSFVTNPLYTRTDGNLESEIRSNPRIREILGEYNLPLKVNVRELERLQQGHLQNTRAKAVQIYSNLPPELRAEVNLKDLQEAAMLHDYGKILIPESVLNKPQSLNERENEVMKLHSELGYEILKNKGLSENVLNLIKYHHVMPDNSGYPKVNGDYTPNIESQILHAADKYSALTEKRSYKPALTPEEALNELKTDLDNGYISHEVYNAAASL